MATIVPTLEVSNLWTERNSVRYKYAAMGNADTGEALQLGGHSDRSVQVTGTFGGATVVIEGSNDGTNWATLEDSSGTALSFTSADFEQVKDVSRFIRARTSGGAGTSVDVTFFAKG